MHPEDNVTNFKKKYFKYYPHKYVCLVFCTGVIGSLMLQFKTAVIRKSYQDSNVVFRMIEEKC